MDSIAKSRSCLMASKLKFAKSVESNWCVYVLFLSSCKYQIVSQALDPFLPASVQVER